MASVNNSSSFFQQFVTYSQDGRVDIRRAMKAFEESFQLWCKGQGAIKPAIMEELKTYGKLGEGKLITFTMHHLKLPQTTETIERIKTALQEMAETGTIIYTTSENGNRRGRNTGWQIAQPPRTQQ